MSEDRDFVIRPMLRVPHQTGIITPKGAIHIVEHGTRHSVCGRDLKTVFTYDRHGGDYASCRHCIKLAGYEPPEPISQQEFDALAREHGIDMHHWHASIQEEAYDNDGMPIVHYPADSYERLLAALARVV